MTKRKHDDPHKGLDETVAKDPQDFVNTGFKGKPQAYENRDQGPAGAAKEHLRHSPHHDGAEQTDRYNRAQDRGDMRSLGPREAAMEIAPTLQTDATSRMDPETAHGMQYIKEVCGHLGLEPTPENVEHVRLTLRQHRIRLHAGNEYPKWVGEGGDRVIVTNREEEDKFNSNREVLLTDKQNAVPAGAGLAGRDAPPYEPFAGPREPGAPNRPTEPAPVASPVSDSHDNAPTRDDGFPVNDANPNPTPNPQPGDSVRTGPSEFEKDQFVPGKSSGNADPHVDGQKSDDVAKDGDKAPPSKAPKRPE